MNVRQCKTASAWPRGAVAALAAMALGACATGGDGLGGRVWSTEAGRFIDGARVVTAVRAAVVALLGETHTIAAHHRLQARLIRAADRDRGPAIVFEMIRRDQQSAIEQWRSDGADPAAFGAAVEWEARGWPDWSTYRPIVEAAVARGLPIHGGAPPREVLERVGHRGLAALDPQRRRALGLDRPLPEPGHGRLVATLRAVHCGLEGDGRMLDTMVAVQRLRDAYLAERLRMAVRRRGTAVLIAGRGHTRTDHGVPLYLGGRLAGSRLVTVALAGTGEFPDTEALRRAQGGTLGHDYVWLTPGGEPAPPCDGDTGGG